jgi:hypothetical protein
VDYILDDFFVLVTAYHLLCSYKIAYTLYKIEAVATVYSNNSMRLDASKKINAEMGNFRLDFYIDATNLIALYGFGI